MGNTIEREQDPAHLSPAPVSAPGYEAQTSPTKERSRQLGDSLHSVHFQLGYGSELEEVFQEEYKVEWEFDYRVGILQAGGKGFSEGRTGTRKSPVHRGREGLFFERVCQTIRGKSLDWRLGV